MRAFRLFSALLFAIAMCAALASAQDADGDQPPPPPEAAPGRTPPPPFEDTRDQNRTEEPQFRHGLSAVSGTVKRADGKALPDDAVVEVQCLGQALAAVTTRGRFQVVVAPPTGVRDAPGDSSSPDLTGCEVRARLSGFQEATVALGALPPGRTETGLVVLHPLAGASGFSYTATTALAPKEARKAWEKGRVLLAQGKHKEAVPYLRKATTIYARFAVAWFELGAAYHQMGEGEEAHKAYAAAIDADSRYLPPYVRMAMLAASHRAWDVVESLTEQVIRHNPYEYPEAFLYHAAASYNLGKTEAAEESARRAIALDTPGRWPRAQLLLARILIETGRGAEAKLVVARYLELTEGNPAAEEGRALLRSQPVNPAPFVMPGHRE